MGSTDEIDVVLLQELLDDGLTESVRDAAIILSPARLALLRVGPHQVAEQAVLWHLGRPGDLLQLGDGDELGAESTMHAQDFVVDQRSDRHAVEYVLEFFPHADRVSSLAFIVEAVNTIDLSALVVTAQQEEILLEFDLIRQEQDNGLKWILASVDVVSQEEVVSLGWEPAILEEAKQISKLSMGVT